VCAILTDLRKDTVFGVVADCIILMELGLSLLQERNGIRQSVTGALEESYYDTWNLADACPSTLHKLIEDGRTGGRAIGYLLAPGAGWAAVGAGSSNFRHLSASSCYIFDLDRPNSITGRGAQHSFKLRLKSFVKVCAAKSKIARLKRNNQNLTFSLPSLRFIIYVINLYSFYPREIALR
jgi:hypothetical protein